MKKKQISIKNYALGFILSYILIFSISSFIALLDIKQLQNNINQENYNSGKKELVAAINMLVDKHKAINTKFSQWDEVRQQIDNPEHYAYWQTHRLLNKGILDDEFIEAAVYDINGYTLDEASTFTLPDSIDSEGLMTYFNIENKAAQFVIISPVIGNTAEQSNKTLGYVATKSHALPLLLHIKQFDHIQLDSIKLQLYEKTHIPVNQLINYFSFEIKKSSEALLITGQIKQILFKNSSILIIFALIFYFLISYFLSLPLRKISAYIDTLNNAGCCLGKCL